MTPERWRQVSDVFHRALALAPTARNAFLVGECQSDPALRAEVERMLSAHGSLAAESAESTGALPTHLEPGATIGSYRVDAFIGAGGMGEVYRATDTRLRRTVAIKILSPSLSAQREFRVRFEREAQLLAALNHPNIGAIYGLEDAGGVQALALEFVEGPTLEGRTLPVREALAIARQIADALEAAHDKGIIHRDLKPANIKLTPAGVVKVLDFGIAKALNPSSDDGGSTFAATREGVVIGTASYMSPEQARGQALDKRTDIWAFGCVLYEMLSGRRPFDGATRSDTLVKVLERAPDWDALPATVPHAIRTLVRRCLEKDPAQRLHDIADARIELGEALAAPSAGASPSTPAVRGRERWLWVALVGAGIAIALLSWAAFGRGASLPAPAAVKFGIHFPDNYIPGVGVAVSPDGRHIAAGIFGSGADIRVHSLDSGTRVLPGTDGGMGPFWSPDGGSVGFYTLAGELRRVTFPEGAPAVICQVPRGPLSGTWNTEGVIVFAAGRQLFRVPAAGGTPTPIRINADLGDPWAPRFLPDQRHFIYYASKPGAGSVVVGSIDDDEVTRVIDSDAPGTFAPPNRLLFVRGTALMAQTFDPHRLALEGQAVAVASGVAAGALVGFASVSASADVLAFATPRGGSLGQLTWVDRAGKALGVVEGPPDGEYLNPALSPDGTLIAVNRMDPQTGDWDLWIIDEARDLSWRLTTNPATDSDPVWSPDGKEIVFASNRGGSVGLYRKAINASGPEETLITVAGQRGLIPSDWSSDGKYILYSQAGQAPAGTWSVWALPLVGDRKAFLLIDDTHAPYGARLSPDGRWLASNSFETKRQEVYVQRFMAAGQKRQISQGGGVHPRWTADGRELVYWAVPGGINAVDFASDGSTFTIGARRTLVQRPVLSVIDGRPHYDITRDGKRLLVRLPSGPQGPGINVIVNWAEKLK